MGESNTGEEPFPWQGHGQGGQCCWDRVPWKVTTIRDIPAMLCRALRARCRRSGVARCPHQGVEVMKQPVLGAVSCLGQKPAVWMASPGFPIPGGMGWERSSAAGL